MKHSFYLLLLVSISIFAKAQNQQASNVIRAKSDTVFLDEGNDKIKLRGQAVKYRITKPDPNVTNGKIEHTYYMGGQLFSELYYQQEPQKDNPKKTTNIREGIYREWYENGNPKQQASYSNNKFNGEFITYWNNKQKRRTDHYTDGKCTDGICYDSTGVTVTYCPYQQMPVFPGGEKELLNFISHNLLYPVAAQENGVQGTVVIRFIVTKEGKVDKIRVLRPLNPDTDREACRVVSILPDWTPGKEEGEPVNVYYTLPVKYRLVTNTQQQSFPFNPQNIRNF